MSHVSRLSYWTCTHCGEMGNSDLDDTCIKCRVGLTQPWRCPLCLRMNITTKCKCGAHNREEYAE